MSRAAADDGPRLRAVVVAWGRSETLFACLDAIEAACSGIAHEIVVVLAPGDAAGAAAAERAEVRVPPPGEPSTPGANRNRGAAGATAPYLAFVDGDAIVDPDFVHAALARLDAAPALGGVGGRVHERQREGDRIVREIPDAYRSGSGGPVEMLATAWIARRSAFEAVRGFDPRLPAEEDVELCIRLADAGHAVVALDRRAAVHECPPRPSFAEFRRRWGSGLYAGQGLLLRYAWGTPAFGRHLARQRLYLGALAFALLGGGLGAAALAGMAPARTAFGGWLWFATFGFVVMALRKGGLAMGALAIATWVVLGAGIVRAWAIGPRAGGSR